MGREFFLANDLRKAHFLHTSTSDHLCSPKLPDLIFSSRIIRTPNAEYEVGISYSLTNPIVEKEAGRRNHPLLLRYTDNVHNLIWNAKYFDTDDLICRCKRQADKLIHSFYEEKIVFQVFEVFSFFYGTASHPHNASTSTAPKSGNINTLPF